MHAGRDVNVQVLFFSAPPAGAPANLRELVEVLVPARAGSVRDGAQVSDRTSASVPLEAALDNEIDGYRDLVAAGRVKVAVDLLLKRLRTLPAGASGRIIFRVKANIGRCYLQLGDETEAQRWLSDAYDAAPEEPKAIANKALAFIVAGRSQEAFDFCREALQRDPTNEHAAAHLFLAAIPLDVEDPAVIIPPALLEREEVILSRVVFMRGKEQRPEWWRLAAKAAADFPGNGRIQFFASEAVVDEVTRDPAFQTMRKIGAEQRAHLSKAAVALEAQWERAKQSDVPDGEMGVSVLGDAMLARQVLGDFEIAAALAGELIARTDDRNLLFNAVQVALFSRRQELALDALTKLGDSPRAKFYRAMIHLERNEWADAAACFQKAEVPEPEKPIAATVIALAPLRAAGAAPDAKAFELAMKEAEGEPRCLVLVARTARAGALPELAAQAFGAAVALIGKDSTLAERSMVAAYAAGDKNYGAVIGLLDGHIEEHRASEELMMLAEAHALEEPPRARNLDFFERLPQAARDLDEIARLRASVLMRAGRYGEAEALFRSVARKHPDDPYPLLGLADALSRLGRDRQVPAVLLGVDENALRGPPEYRMRFAHALKHVGALDRALQYAYSLVRTSPDNPKVVLGYVFMILGDKDQSIIPEAPVVAAECWVKIQNGSGETDDFVIDAGPSFFGIDVRSPEHPSAKRVLGLKVGDEFDVDKGPMPAERWKVVGIKSRFLHLLHVAMERFEQKFPDAKGMWRFTVKDNDVSGMLDMICQLSEANQERAKSYTEGGLPLAFVARMMGGDAASFAQYVRSLGGNIVTCTGRDDEFAAAGKLAIDARGQGAALDFYTAWVAAEIGILDTLHSWFGRLVTPQSTIEEIDSLIAREEEGLGGRMMTVVWRDGQFYRHEVTDEFVASQVAALRAIKDAILANCEVVNSLLPNDLSDLALQILNLFGGHSLDSVYLARSEKMILLSDDLRYREIARMDVRVPGLWLQTALSAALQANAVERPKVTEAYVRLAARRHDHVRLDSRTLRDVYDRCGDSDLREFDVITDFIGGRQADMRSHTMVTGQFLAGLWNEPVIVLKAKAATGLLLNKLLRHRQREWFVWLALLLFISGNAFVRYVEDWLKGHFLPTRPVIEAYRAWEPQIAGRQSHIADHASAIALHVAGAV